MIAWWRTSEGGRGARLGLAVKRPQAGKARALLLGLVDEWLLWLSVSLLPLGRFGLWICTAGAGMVRWLWTIWRMAGEDMRWGSREAGKSRNDTARDGLHDGAPPAGGRGAH